LIDREPTPLKTKETSVNQEQQDAALIAQKLRTPLRVSGDAAKDNDFRKGGYKQAGYGVSAGAAVDGSHAFEGNQGYYAEGGEQIFVGGVEAMKRFFKRHAAKGKPIRYVVKTGIGGQHTPFQGIADAFALVDPQGGRVVGEYELGKDFEAAIDADLKALGAGWDQVAVIPSSKSGSTDETMVIFVQILRTMLKRSLLARLGGERKPAEGYVHTTEETQRAETLVDEMLDYLREMNVPRDKQGAELFKGFSFDALAARLKGKDGALDAAGLTTLFKDVLGRMFFETTDKPAESRLSAFIRNSGLDKALGDDAPGFGAMFENVGGRWTADLHMMTFLAYYDLDAKAYWSARREQIAQVREGKHKGNDIAHEILDNGITDIALLVPDVLFWFGKSNEQNFNESIWQTGFANLVTVPESLWESQKAHYREPHHLVIDLTGKAPASGVRVISLGKIGIGGQRKAQLAETFATLFSTFYGMTNTVGCRLIARALRDAGRSAADVDMNDLSNPATKIVQENLFLRQPYVELGKGLVDERFKKLQDEEKANAGAIGRALFAAQRAAAEGQVVLHADGLSLPNQISTHDDLVQVLNQSLAQAKKLGRKFVPFLYLEGEKFQEIRVGLTRQGIEWVLQGTGDQHISYQQVLAQPKKYFVLFISFLPKAGGEIPGIPAVGFAKAHLDRISPHLLRDSFAEASYKALTDLRSAEGGQGVFVRMSDSPEALNFFKKTATEVAAR
jgi:hypothetical protein